MTGYLTINGVSSMDFNVVLSDAGVYGRAEKDQTFVSVPGRNGDLVIDNNRYKNLTLSYPCVIYKDFDTNYAAFIGFLLSQGGYMRLEDSFHPDEYVLAQYVGETKPKSTHMQRIGSFELKFNRKPQRFLKSGEDPISFTSNGQIINNEQTTALPLVRVYGTGQVGVGNQTITVNSLASGASYTDIDCDLQDAFYQTTNCNSRITLNSGGFFKLKPGVNGITKGEGGSVSRVEITPRWWRL